MPADTPHFAVEADGATGLALVLLVRPPHASASDAARTGATAVRPQRILECATCTRLAKRATPAARPFRISTNPRPSIRRIREIRGS
jgi:hypothetical protein